MEDNLENVSLEVLKYMAPMHTGEPYRRELLRRERVEREKESNMAKVEKCDGCGAMSPDENGLYQANNWVEVVVKKRKFKWLHSSVPDGDFLFCQECLSGETQANKASTRLGLLIEKIGTAMGFRPSQ